MTLDHAPDMLNNVLTPPSKPVADRRGTALYQLMVAGFIMAVGLSIAGAGTHLYQGLVKQQAVLRYDGKTYFHSVGHLVVSFVCGPYIMLQMGMQHEAGETISLVPALLSAAVAFSWSFITGLLFMGVYFAAIGG
jgi:hypothetical protein